MTITSTVMTITPEVAMVLLERNILNRAISDSRVAFYARQMLEGYWKLNGEAIIISDKGNLIEGQHRLWACVNFQIPFTTLVTEGVSEDTFDTINSGRTRSIADVLHIIGYKYTSRLASALRIYKGLTDGVLPVSSIITSGRAAITGYEAKELAGEHPQLLDISVAIANDAFLGKLVPVGLTAALAYIFSQDNHDLAQIWLKGLMTGENLHEGSSILALRNRLSVPPPPGKKINAGEYYAYIVNSWNAFIKGETLTFIKGTMSTKDGTRIYPKIAKKRAEKAA